MLRAAALGSLLLLAIAHGAMSITVQEFFPDVKNNLTTIKWSHATNSKAKLEEALKSSQVMMIEADVITRKVANASDEAVMGHNQGDQSDLTLEDFIKQITANKTKGFKLDFKTIEAANAGMEVLKKFGNLTVPVWLNADILKGPVNATDVPMPVKAQDFLAAAAQHPQALLSIGWTTRLEEGSQNATQGKYTSEQIDEMVKVVQESKTNQSITYPVRACYVVNDVDVLKSLLSKTIANNPTLTIWSSEGDKVDEVKLSAAIKSLGEDNVFVDVPQTLWQKLTLGNSAFAAQSSHLVLLASLLSALCAVKLL